MEVIVIWTESAIAELQNIHDYFAEKAGGSVANKITDTIVDRSLMLEQAPRAGQVEELLKHCIVEVRYLVEGNYKIVYMIDKQLVVILTVFDCRQNPSKLKKKRI